MIMVSWVLCYLLFRYLCRHLVKHILQKAFFKYALAKYIFLYFSLDFLLREFFSSGEISSIIFSMIIFLI